MSAETLRRVELPSGGWVEYDSDMPMGALRAVMRAGASGNMDDLFNGLSRMIINWSFDGDPSNVDAWDDLRRSTFNEIVKGTMEDLGSLGN